MRNGNDDGRATNRPELTSTRRSLLKASSAGFLGTAAFGGGAGITAAQSAGEGDGPLRLEIEQGGRTYEVDPVATGESVESVYDRLGDSTSAGASTLAFVDGPDGPSLVVRNDDGDAEAGGEVSYSFDELPADGSWVVRDPDGSERVWPSDTDAGSTCRGASGQIPTTGQGASNHFGWGGCGSWKEFDVEPGRTYRVRAYTDGCFSCVLYDATHEVREPTDDGSWETTFEWDDPMGEDASTEYAYTPESDAFRVHNLDGNSGQGFYVHVYDTSVDATYGTSEAAWSWTEGRTTGGAFRGDLAAAGDVEVAVDLDGASGVEVWELLSGADDGSDAFELDPSEPVTIRATTNRASLVRVEAPGTSVQTGGAASARVDLSAPTATREAIDVEAAGVVSRDGQPVGDMDVETTVGDGDDDLWTVALSASPGSGVDVSDLTGAIYEFGLRVSVAGSTLLDNRPGASAAAGASSAGSAPASAASTASSPWTVYNFDRVDRLAVIPALASDESPPSSKADTLTAIREAGAFVNEYYASSLGSLGAHGF